MKFFVCLAVCLKSEKVLLLHTFYFFGGLKLLCGNIRMSGSFSTYNSTYNWTDTRKYQSTNNGFSNIFYVHYSAFSELLSIVSTAGGRWHSRGQRFDPAYLHQKGLENVSFQIFFCF